MAGWGWVRRNAGLITESAHLLEKSAPTSTDTSLHRLVGNLRLASDPSCLYCIVTSESRGVETTSPAPRLGTWGGESRWCDRLSEVVTTSVAHLALSGK